MAEEISREALLVYLDNLRTLETIAKESEEKKANVSTELELKSNNIVSDLKEPIEPQLKLQERTSNGVFIGVALVAIIFLIIGFACYSAGSIFSWLCGIMFLFLGGLLGWYLIWGIRKEISIKEENDTKLYKYQCDKKDYDEKIEEYKKRERAAHTQVRDLKSKATQCIQNINDEEDEIHNLIQQAYSVNIIPLQFRNIQGIYYLYDYLSTSNQSLSDALMQCNLEAIKQKLDQIISLQSETIIQQAQANAMLYEQNQRILETAQATMQNTAIAAKYAQISAVNSQLGLKMQSKQLAYQRAEFWLE